MASPSGIFVGLTAAELASLKATALARLTGGQFTALSGAQKSSSIEYTMDPAQLLIEIKYAEGNQGPSVVYQDFRGLRQMPNTVNG